MNSVIPYIVLAIAAGFCLPTQAGINSRLNIWAQSPVLAAAISFGVSVGCFYWWVGLSSSGLTEKMRFDFRNNSLSSPS